MCLCRARNAGVVAADASDVGDAIHFNQGEALMARQRGKVKWFDDAKGYGFIGPADKSKDVFVHYSQIAGCEGYKKLMADDMVEFEIVPGGKGPQAEHVIKL